MKLFSVIEKAREEYEQNEQTAQVFATLLKKIDDAKTLQKQLEYERETLLAGIRKRFERDEITMQQVYLLNEKVNSNINKRLASLNLPATEQEEKALLSEYGKIMVSVSRYSNIITQLYNSRAVINNQHLCALLKTNTKKQWSWQTIYDKNNSSIKLWFTCEDGKSFVLDQVFGIKDKEEEIRYYKAKLDNTNWFSKYLTTRNFEQDLIYDSSDNQFTIIMPQEVRTSIENFFKTVNVDENNPQNLCFQPDKPVEPYKEKNFVAIVARDAKKAASEMTKQ